MSKRKSAPTRTPRKEESARVRSEPAAAPVKAKGDEETLRLASFPMINPHPIVEADLEGNVRFANPAALRLFPDIREQGLEHPWLADWAAVVEAFRGGTTIAERETAVGSRYYHQAMYFVTEAQLVRIYGLDITTRKQAQNVLREREEQLRLFVEHAPAAIAMFDAQMRYISFSRRWLTDYGLQGQELRGRSHYEVFPEIPEHWKEIHRRGMAGSVEHLDEEAFVRGDGSVQWLRWEMRPWQLASGEIGGIVIFSEDITARIETEQALKRQNALLQGVNRILERAQEIAHLGSWELDPVGNRLVWSDEVYRIFGLRPQEFAATYDTFLERIHPDDRAAVDEAYSSSLREGKSEYEIEHRIVRGSTGEIRWVLEKCQHMRDADGRVTLSLGMVLDVTERRRNEEALRRAKDELEQRVRERTAELAARASQLRALARELTLTEQRERRRMARLLHDHLQQLLVGAKFRVAILGRTGDELVKQATREVEELIDESIAASRSLTAELSPPILHEAGLNAGLEWLARWMADKHGLFVELALEETAPLAEDIKILVFESIRELLFNAVKHSHSRSASVNLREIARNLQIVVSDQGVGFDPGLTPTAGDGGGGFGLFGIRERMGLIGGSLEIDSAPGQGSRFVLTVPLGLSMAADAASVTDAALLRDEPPAQDAPVSAGAKIRVLLADDHAVVRQGLANLLNQEADMDVVGGAVDGQEAVELAARLLPDVILMDMSMPRLTGVEATRFIHNEYPDIRIIGLSMFEGVERAQAIRDAGAVDYLTKTGPAEALVGAIRRACAQKW